MAIVWEEKMRLGIPAIDEQHENMFEQLARLTDAITSGACGGKVSEILGFLKDYAETHFLEEEELMTEYGYDGIEEQRQQHAVFKQNVSELLAMLDEKAPAKALAIRIDALLIRYAINHIRNLDFRLVEFIREKLEKETLVA